MKSSFSGNPSEVQCSKCSSLLEFFQSLVLVEGTFANVYLSKACWCFRYCDLTKENDFYLKSVFDAKVNYFITMTAFFDIII